MKKFLFHFMGSNMHYIIFIITLFLLQKYTTVFLFYCIGFIISTCINICLKLIIQQPRPIASYEYQNSFTQKYGMPSGHSQFCGFSLVYICLHQKTFTSYMVYSILSFITLLQRFVSQNHTLLQIVVGFIIGCFIGYTCHLFVVRYLENK